MQTSLVRMYCVISALCAAGISMTVAIYTPYLEAAGLSKAEANLVNAAFFTSMFIFEVPTGVFADVFGRKRSFVLCCTLFGAGMFFYATRSSFWGFVAAEAFLGFAATFGTGAFDAWFNDQMLHEGATDEEIQSGIALEAQLSALVGPVGAILGVWLWKFCSWSPWALGGGIYVATGFYAYLAMKEGYFRRRAYTFSRVRAAIRKTVRVSIAEAKVNSAVRFVLLLLIFQLVAVQCPNMQWALVYRGLWGEEWNGFVWLGISLALSLGARLTRKFKDEEGVIANPALLLRSAQCAAGVGLLIAGLAMRNLWLSFFWFWMHEVARGFFGPVQRGYLNRSVPSSVRATVLSFASLASRFGCALGLLLGSVLMNFVGISAAWQISGAFLLAVTFLLRKR